MGYQRIGISELGSALIIVLVFSTLIALVCVMAMESSVLQLKMVNNFLLMKKTQQEAESKLLLLEEKLENYFYEDPPADTDFIQFVPDTLLFGETQGSNYYSVKVKHENENDTRYSIMTTYGARKGKNGSHSFQLAIKDTNFQSSQDSLLLYHINEHLSWNRVEWKAPVSVKLSEPLYDVTLDSLIELDKVKKPLKMPPLVSVMDSNGYIWRLNHQGEIVDSIDLKKGEQSLLEQWQSATLTSANFFGGNQWHRMIVGVMPTQPMTLFALNVTEQKTSDNLLWRLSLPIGAVAQKPAIVRFANECWGIVYTYFMNSQGYIVFADIQNGHIFKEIKLPRSHTAFNGKKIELSAIATADLKNRGFCDAVYVGDESGRLWKIIIDSPQVSDWHVEQQLDPSSGKIIGQPIIGKHPQGKGEMVYLLIEGNDKRHKIVAIATDEQDILTHTFTIDEHCVMHQPLLRQGYLIIHKDELHEINKIIIYDSFTGKKLRDSPLIFLAGSPSLKLCVPFYAPVVFTIKPREKENLVLAHGARGLAMVRIKIDFERLGRRTWETSLDQY